MSVRFSKNTTAYTFLNKFKIQTNQINLQLFTEKNKWWSYRILIKTPATLPVSDASESQMRWCLCENAKRNKAEAVGRHSHKRD